MSQQTNIPVSHPWCWVDMDGTLCEDNHYPRFGKPRPGARKALYEFKHMGLRIMVFTARTAMLGLDGKYQDVNQVIEEIKAWAQHNDIPIDYVFPLPKPTHILFGIDDRAISIVNPPDPSMDHEMYWQDVVATVKARFGHKLQNWQREVTPTTFGVQSGS